MSSDNDSRSTLIMTTTTEVQPLYIYTQTYAYIQPQILFFIISNGADKECENAKNKQGHEWNYFRSATARIRC